MPADDGLRTEPGTAITWMSRSAASSTVCIEPPAAWDSTTTTRSASAAMIRLRAGNRHAAGPSAERRLAEQQAARRATRPHRSRCWAGYTTSSPLPTTPTGRATGVEHAAVGGAVDAEGQAGHDGHARLGELAAELAGEPGARRRCTGGCRRSRPATVAERREVALREEHAPGGSGRPRSASG